MSKIDEKQEGRNVVRVAGMFGWLQNLRFVPSSALLLLCRMLIGIVLDVCRYSSVLRHPTA